MQKVLMSASKRDVSKQETALMFSNKHDYVQFSLSMRHCSLTGNKVISTDQDKGDAKVSQGEGYQTKYWNRLSDQKFLDAVKEYESDEKSWLDRAPKNWKSPKHPLECSLYDYNAYFTKDWKLQNHDSVPVFKPFFRNVPKRNNKERYEEFCRVRLLTFLPGSTPTNLLEGFETCADRMDDFVKNSKFCLPLLKEEVEKASKNLDQIQGDDDDDDDDDDDGPTKDAMGGPPDLCPEVEGIS